MSAFSPNLESKKRGQLKMKKIATILLACAMTLLAGCQTPIVHGVNQVLNMGGELPENMRQRNISAVVAFDEAWAGDYNMTTRNHLYLHGVVSGTPEYGMRVVRVNMRHPEYGAWVRVGDKAWITAAIVPDHMEVLKAGDYVEIRQTGTHRTVENFVAKGEGNIVLRVLCRAADPKYEECAAALPRMGRYLGFGETGTYYPESIREYGFTFTPKYDSKGKPLR